MSRALLAVAAIAVVLLGGAARGAGEPAGRLTLRVWLEVGYGTGAISSPSTLCEVAPTGAGPVRRISDEVGFLGDAAWDRVGSSLAFVRYDGARSRHLLQVAGLGGWRPRTVARSTGQLRSPAWSPEGRSLAFVSLASGRSGLYVTGADGSGLRILVRGAVESPTWSPDGAEIAFGRGGAIWAARVGGGGGERRVTADGALPAWSPDGDRIAFVGGGVDPGDQELYVVRPDGEGRAQVSSLAPPAAIGPRLVSAGRPAWSPDGAFLAVVRTVTVPQPKGSNVTRTLVLEEVDGPGQRTSGAIGALAEPAWRAGPSITAAEGAARPCTIQPDQGAERIIGTGYDDLILGFAGDDAILGLRGSDWIHAGHGADRVTGGPGRDEIWTGRGRDTVLARDGARDVVHCGEAASDAGAADRFDQLLGSCRRVVRR
ncbi:MAG: hypothetical protein ABR521_07990 [Gaiellaceae bacterium]